MLKAGDKIFVRIRDHWTGKHIRTNDYNTVYIVKEKNGKLGIDRNTDHSPLTCGGDIFTPFDIYCNTDFIKIVENQA